MKNLHFIEEYPLGYVSLRLKGLILNQNVYLCMANLNKRANKRLKLVNYLLIYKKKDYFTQ